MHVPHGVTNTPHVTDEVSMCVAPTRARKSRALDRLSSTDLRCDRKTIRRTYWVKTASSIGRARTRTRRQTDKLRSSPSEASLPLLSRWRNGRPRENLRALLVYVAAWRGEERGCDCEGFGDWNGWWWPCAGRGGRPRARVFRSTNQSKLNPPVSRGMDSTESWTPVERVILQCSELIMRFRFMVLLVLGIVRTNLVFSRVLNHHIYIMIHAIKLYTLRLEI
jgi:hypothetical protein